MTYPTCSTCGADISNRRWNAQFCKPCAKKRISQRCVEYRRARYLVDEEFRKRKRENERMAYHRRKWAKVRRVLCVRRLEAA